VGNDQVPLAARFRILGRVQGVGFRPFVARLASSLNVRGWVKNTPEGVFIHAEGPADVLTVFGDRLRREPPPAAEIHDISRHDFSPEGHRQFLIHESELAESGPAILAVITPDLAACSPCLAEFDSSFDRRFGFALSGCTDCGPRFSIQTSAPFDRERTTMLHFALCAECGREYADPADRRFHAQNIACPRCGPRIWLETEGSSGLDSAPTSALGLSHSNNDLPVIAQAAASLRSGKILAVKGIGGFHLFCDATAPETVQRLRERKRRDRKPFAVLFADLEELDEHAELGDAASPALRSPAAPIVLLKRRESSTLAAAVAPGLGTLGAFLAYTPLHRALIRAVGTPLVATSGNPTDEPMPVDNDVARAELGPIADAFLLHDRRILRHADDSVVRMIGGRPVPVRIGRGLAPVRIELPIEPLSLLATGGHLKAAIAFTRGRELFLGQHIGDLDTLSAQRRYRENVADLTRLFGVRPETVVHDRHPDYFTTRFAQEAGLPLIAVQHHHAHVLACLAEHGERGPALGIAWDGTGYGDDGTIWGGEFLIVDGPHYRRAGSIWPFPLVGGDRAAREPRRSAAGVCFEAGIEIPEHCGFSAAEGKLLVSALNSTRARAATTTSAGRLFDAWASLAGILHHSAYEAEAAMRFEDLADANETAAFDVSLVHEPNAEGRPTARVDWRPWVGETVRLLKRGCPPGLISAYFHNGLAQGAFEVARWAGQETVVLSGGCFLNRRLAERTEWLLEQAGFRVLTHRLVPPGDGGLAVGQVWAAALRLCSGST
jgi:hydrogenase maturation protein HypF